MNMAKKNLSALDRQVCDCQHDLDAWEKEPLVEVKDRYHYEHKHKSQNVNDRQGMGWDSGPDIPTTDDETEITRENFPESNLVCPCCGKEWLAVVDVYPLSEKGDRPENSLTDDEWEKIETALKVQTGFVPDEKTDDWKQVLNKIRR